MSVENKRSKRKKLKALGKPEIAARSSVDKSKPDNKQIDKRRIKEDRLREKAAKKAELCLLREKENAERAKEIAAKNAITAQKRARRKAFYGRIRRKLKNRPEGFSRTANYGILPRIEFEVNGDRASIAARLSSCGLAFGDMTADGGVTRFKIRKKEKRKVIAILNEMCYNYRISATFGIVRSAAYWLSRCGLIVGVAAAAVAMNIAYGYVWRVDISGNDKLSDATIESALYSAGVSVGCKKSAADGIVARAEAALVGLDGIVDASVTVSGTTMSVRVLEATEHSVHSGGVAYVSDYDATVTRVVMRSGTAKVKRGDVVKNGDLLASGDVYSTAGELLYTGECDADVYGNIAVTLSADISPTYVEYRRTGNVQKRTVAELFGLKLGKTDSKFDSYETVARKANYDVLIPLYMTRYEYYELAPLEITRDIDEAAKAFAQEKIDEMGFVGKFDYSYNVSELVSGLYTVHVFLSGETLISKPVDTLPAPPEQSGEKENKN